MKKLSLLLALILVLTCGVLAACGDETETSSTAPESSEAKTESSALAEEASSEADVEASSETEDASSEAPDDDSSAPAQGEVPDELKGTNVALNKSYTGGDPAITSAGGAPCQYSANLTDGVAGTDGKAYDSTWFALWYNATSTLASNNAPDGIGTIVIDLGAKTDGINAVRVHVNNANTSGICAAESIVAYVSDDNSSWTELGALVIPEGDDPDWAALAVDNASGQYVKIVIDMGPDSWCFLNEIEVYAE